MEHERRENFVSDDHNRLHIDRMTNSPSVVDINKFRNRHSQDSIKDFIFQDLHVNDAQRNKTEFRYKNNKINTTKYNIFTFLPKGILYQFLKINNFYFLTIGILQLTSLSPISPLTTAAFAFVITLSLIREGIEDYARHRYDNQINSEKCTVYKSEKWAEVKSQDISMGDIVLVKNANSFTSDLLLLDSNLKDGICYIETANLDGERNSKLKISSPSTAGLFKYFINNNENKKILTSFKEQNKNNEHVIDFDSNKHNNLNLNEENLPTNKISEKPTNIKEIEEIALVNYQVEKQKNSNLKSINSKIPIDQNFKEENWNLFVNNNFKASSYYNNNPIENFNISGNVRCSKPNPTLYELSGNLKIKFKREDFTQEKEIKCDIDKGQLLLKGSILRNCKWVIGIAIYTGMNTKIMLNSNKPTIKFSKIDNILAKLLILVFFIQVAFNIVSAGLNSYFYYSIVMDQHQLENSKNPALSSFLVYFTYMVLLNTMIPISLIITIELVKMAMSIFIKSDIGMYSKLRDKFATTGTVSLLDELGMVDYVFSDKTGTLTLNKMDFKYSIIGTSCYKYYKNLEEKIKFFQNDENNQLENIDNSILMEEKLMKSKTTRFGKNYFSEFRNIASSQEKKYPNYKVESTANSKIFLNLDTDALLADEYWKAIYLCHECIINENNEIAGASQDDIELVSTAISQGYILLPSEDSKIIKLKINNEEKAFPVVKMIEFSSARKRASILINDNGVYKLFIKGADSEIEKRLSSKSRKDFKETAFKYINYFSNLGYRTLLLGMKVITEEEAMKFEKKIKEAEKLSPKSRDSFLSEYYNLFERDFHLLGAAVQEDKLQENVPNTIRDLRLANIKIWMLTGDKIETAISIGKSCQLIPSDNDSNLFIVLSKESFKSQMKNFAKDFNLNSNESRNEFYLAISGEAISDILSDEESYKMFEFVSRYASSVVCARFSPKQKADVVEKMKKLHPSKIMLSIGDGGNDVSMLLAAHIGIGVFGEEGSQAVQASDFAIGEFKMLRRLLFYHGRINHIRISQMILYFFYKNFFFTIIQFYFGFFNNFSGQPALDEWYITLYNIFFTAFPLVTRALFDHDIKPEDGIVVEKMLPFLYDENRENPEFSKTKLLLNIFRGFLYGIFNYFFTLRTCLPDSINNEGYPADHFIMSSILFSNIYHGVSARVLLLNRYITHHTVLVFICFSYLLYIMYISIMNTVVGFKSTGAVYIVFTSGRAYLNMIFVIITVALCDYLTLSVKFHFNKSISNTLSKLRAKLGHLEDEKKMPRAIQEKLEIYKIIEKKLLLINQIHLGDKDISSVFNNQKHNLLAKENSLIIKQRVYNEKKSEVLVDKINKNMYEENKKKEKNNLKEVISDNIADEKNNIELKNIHLEEAKENIIDDDENNLKINNVKIIKNKPNITSTDNLIQIIEINSN